MRLIFGQEGRMYNPIVNDPTDFGVEIDGDKLDRIFQKEIAEKFTLLSYSFNLLPQIYEDINGSISPELKTLIKLASSLTEASVSQDIKLDTISKKVTSSEGVTIGKNFNPDTGPLLSKIETEIKAHFYLGEQADKSPDSMTDQELLEAKQSFLLQRFRIQQLSEVNRDSYNLTNLINNEKNKYNSLIASYRGLLNEFAKSGSQGFKHLVEGFNLFKDVANVDVGMELGTIKTTKRPASPESDSHRRKILSLNTVKTIASAGLTGYNLSSIDRDLTLRQTEIKECIKSYMTLKLIKSSVNSRDLNRRIHEIYDRESQKFASYQAALEKKLNEKSLNLRNDLSRNERAHNLFTREISTIETELASLKSQKDTTPGFELMHKKLELQKNLYLKESELARNLLNQYELKSLIPQFQLNSANAPTFEKEKRALTKEIESKAKTTSLYYAKVEAMTKLLDFKPKSYGDLIRFANDNPIEMLTLKHEGNFLTKYLEETEDFHDKDSIDSSDIEGIFVGSVKAYYDQRAKIVGYNYFDHNRKLTYIDLVSFIKTGGEVNEEVIKEFSKKLVKLTATHHKEDNKTNATIKALELCAMIEPAKTEKILKGVIHDQVGWFRKAFEFICKITGISKISNIGSVEKRKDLQLIKISDELKTNILKSKLKPSSETCTNRVGKQKTDAKHTKRSRL